MVFVYTLEIYSGTYQSVFVHVKTGEGFRENMGNSSHMTALYVQFQIVTKLKPGRKKPKSYLMHLPCTLPKSYVILTTDVHI